MTLRTLTMILNLNSIKGITRSVFWVIPFFLHKRNILYCPIKSFAYHRQHDYRCNSPESLIYILPPFQAGNIAAIFVVSTIDRNSSVMPPISAFVSDTHYAIRFFPVRNRLTLAPCFEYVFMCFITKFHVIIVHVPHSPIFTIFRVLPGCKQLEIPLLLLKFQYTFYSLICSVLL